jgi:hypothetical protein
MTPSLNHLPLTAKCGGNATAVAILIKDFVGLCLEKSCLIFPFLHKFPDVLTDPFDQ